MDFAPIMDASPILPLAALKFSTLELFLLIGSGLLAVGLLTLALTRWGQAKPIWKCVVLSVMAHILLMAYAYSTQLIWQVPKAAAMTDQPMKITMLDEAGGAYGSDIGIQHNAIDSGHPWMKFASSQRHLPSVDELKRPNIDSELELVSAAPPRLQDPMPNPTQFPAPQMTELSDPFEDQARERAFEGGVSESKIESQIQPQEITRPEMVTPDEAAPAFDSNTNSQPRVQIDSPANQFESTTEQTNPAFTSDLKQLDSQFTAAQPSFAARSCGYEFATFERPIAGYEESSPLGRWQSDSENVFAS